VPAARPETASEIAVNVDPDTVDGVAEREVADAQFVSDEDVE
jgi:hypothetical protein